MPQPLKPGEVVVALPYVGDRVLMQLRDDKPDILFPNYWGFFGGSIERSESAEQAVIREIGEELGFQPEHLHKLGKFSVDDQNGLVSHAFVFPLTVAPEQLELHEGQDMALASLEEVERKILYSRKRGAYFPVSPTRYIADTLRRFLAYRHG